MPTDPAARRLLSRLFAVGVAVVVATGLVGAPEIARAGAVGYTMTCGDHWSGTTTVNRGETARGMDPDGDCTSHYAWVNVYSKWSSSGKKQSRMQAVPGVVVTVWHEFDGQTTRSWHSGCRDGCVSKESRP